MERKSASNRPLAENGCAMLLPLLVLSWLSFGVTFYIGGRAVFGLFYEVVHFFMLYALPGLLVGAIAGVITLGVTRKRTPSFRIRAAVVSGAVVGAIPAILVLAANLLQLE